MRWLLAATMFFAVPAQAATYEQIVHQFEAIAFSDEDGNYQNSLRRWRGTPIVVRPITQHEALVQRVFDELEELSGLIFLFGKPANTYVRFAPGDCFVKTNVFRADIRISNRSPAHCAYEEFAQLVGPANDACHYRPSIFCDSDFLERYADADKIILRAVFDKRLQIGMTRAEGMPIARIIIRELYEEEIGPIRETVTPPPQEEEVSLP